MPVVLTSPQSPLLKKIRKAISQGGRTDDGLAVVEGPKLIAEAWRSPGSKIHRILAVEGRDWDAASGGIASWGGEITWVNEKLFREIKGTEHSQGVLALVEPAASLAAMPATPQLVVALDAIQDPGNAGTMIRTAEAFGASAVAMLKGCVDAWNPKCIRASAGSVFRVPTISVVDPVAELGGLGAWITASGRPGGSTMDAVDWRRPVVLFLGNEGHGVRDAIASRCEAVRIPTRAVESLNAAIAAGILLCEIYRSRSKS